MILRLGVLVLTAGLAAPVLASAQTTTAYDGTYVGVSRAFLGMQGAGRQGNGRSCNKEAGRPGTLTIANGTGRYPWDGGAMVGSVTPQGAIALKNDWGAHLTGQVDRSGTIKAQAGAVCLYELTWQKR